MAASPLSAQSAHVAFDSAAKVFRLDGGNVLVCVRRKFARRIAVRCTGAGGWRRPMHSRSLSRCAKPLPSTPPTPRLRRSTPDGVGACSWNRRSRVTFPDGNRDLVLHYDSHTARRRRRRRRPQRHLAQNICDPALLDRLQPAASWRRSATIENREAAAGHHRAGRRRRMGSPGCALHAELPDRPLGRRMGAQPGDDSPRRPRDREPARHPPATRPIPGSPSRRAIPMRTTGEVWFGALAWSGSWRITVEQDQLDAVRVTGGFNPFDFGYVLQARRDARDPGVLRRLFRITGWAARRGCCIISKSTTFFPAARARTRAPSLAP